jgi:predicted NBD/HSP70 family sugar kinase
MSSVTGHGHLLALIRQREGLSRQQLITETGLSRGTLYERLDTLARLGLVHEAESLGATGGRRPRAIRFSDRGRVVLAVDLGQTHARISVTDLLGTERRRADLPVRLDRGAGPVLDAVLGHAGKLLAAGEGELVAGIGIGVPAAVDPAGHVLHAPTMPGWPADAVVAAAGARFGLPVVVENDARAGAVGECRVEGETLVYVKVATGIGCGIVVGGTALRGAAGVAGDLGHVRVPGVRRERACRCGRTGCLAAHSSGRALAGRLGLGSVGDLVAAAAEPAVRAALVEAADVLGAALATTVSTINPHRLVLGGPLGALPVVVERVRAQVEATVAARAVPQVERSTLGGRAVPRGLARLVTERVFAPDAVDALVAADP